MSIRSTLLERLWHGHDPFAEFDPSSHPVDHQGWNSEHRYLAQAIQAAKPGIVAEIGVWKGGSVKTMAAAAKSLSLDCAVVAIDTWLGSSEHWLIEDLYKQLRVQAGYPRLYHTFMANVLDKGLQDYVVPLPLDSLNALHVFKTRGIQPDVIHIDAGHDYNSAFSDFSHWWQVLKPGGILVGDDYYTDGITWQDVRRAYDDFIAQTPHLNFEGGDGKCIVQKPAA